MKTIESIFDAVSAKQIGIESFESCFDDFYQATQHTEKIYEDKELFIKTYISILIKINSIYCPNHINEDQIPLNIREKVINSFININNVVVSHLKANSNESCIFLLLQESRQDIINSDYNIIAESAAQCIDTLKEIEFIFDLKDENNNLFFPLNRFILQAIQDPGLFDSEQKEDCVRILQLAVRLFKKYNDINYVINKMTGVYNLKFINYLDIDCEILDNETFSNYEANHVMVFFDPKNYNVLIRNNNKDYFDNCDVVQTEYNSNNTPIGYFVESKLKNGKITSVEEILQSNNYRDIKEILNIYYIKEYKNILIRNSLYKTQDSIIPLNRYCKNDKEVIDKFNLLDFNLCHVTNSEINDFNKATFGLCCILLSIKPIDINELFKNLNDLDWYQNQIIYNWITNENVDNKAIIKFLEKYNGELSKNDINFQSNGILPFKSNILKGIYKKLNIDVSNDSSFKIIKGFSLKNNFYILENGNKISKDNIEFDDKSEFYDENTIILIYDEKKEKYYAEEIPLAKQLEQLEELENKSNLLPYGVYQNKGYFYSDLYKICYLFKDSFIQYANYNNLKCIERLENHLYYRIINNLFSYKINTEEKFKKYKDIIDSHQVIDFSSQETVLREKISQYLQNGTLIIPKDNINKDGVLYSVYDNYLKNKIGREKANLYDLKVTEKSDGYYYKGKKINNIAILTDNTLTGTATVNYIQAYLEESQSKTINKSINTIYDSSNKEVKLKQIMEKNNIDNISIICIYGTEEAKKKIEKTFKERLVVSVEIINTIKDCKTNEYIKKCANEIWKNQIKQDFYLIFREFSMPKKTIFPIEFFDINQPTGIFIQKEEYKDEWNNKNNKKTD